MSFLFDSTIQSPQEPTRTRRKARRPAAVPEPSRSGFQPLAIAVAPLGRLDDGVVCLDANCQGECHDIVEERSGRWFLECCFCGTGQWVRATPGHLPPPPKESEFRLRDGRFAGMTLDEVGRAQRGLDYIQWAAAEHPRHAVREAAKTWLASRPVNP